MARESDLVTTQFTYHFNYDLFFFSALLRLHFTAVLSYLKYTEGVLGNVRWFFWPLLV